ncbi:hypothetical protein WICPIJ_002923, partial [Wickerhamomyces pijperi]
MSKSTISELGTQNPSTSQNRKDHNKTISTASAPQISPIEDLSDTKRTTARYKRNRSTRACEVCHSRKVRCDAVVHIPCTNCLTFGSECRFPEPKERKNAKTPLHANGASNSKTISNNGSTSSSRPTEPRKKDPVAAISARTFNIDSTEQKDAFDAMRFFGPSSSVFYILQDKTQDDPYVTLR